MFTKKPVQKCFITCLISSLIFVSLMWGFNLIPQKKAVDFKIFSKDTTIQVKSYKLDTIPIYKKIKDPSRIYPILFDSISSSDSIKSTVPERYIIKKYTRIDTVYVVESIKEPMKVIIKEERSGFDCQTFITWILGSINTLFLIILATKKIFFRKKSETD